MILITGATGNVGRPLVTQLLAHGAKVRAISRYPNTARLPDGAEVVEADPLLPPELLPRPWPGKDARELLARCRKLGVLAREDKDGPALYRVFDDAIAHLP